MLTSPQRKRNTRHRTGWPRAWAKGGDDLPQTEEPSDHARFERPLAVVVSRKWGQKGGDEMTPLAHGT
jgi:hypothetical protein